MGEFFDNMHGKNADQNHLPPLELPEELKCRIASITDGDLGDLCMEWSICPESGNLVAHINCGASVTLDRSRIVVHRYPELLREYMLEEVIDGLGKMIRASEHLREKFILKKKGPTDESAIGTDSTGS